MLTPVIQSVPTKNSVRTPPKAASANLSQYSLSNAGAGIAFVAELSGFEVLLLAKEIDLALRGTYINNIYSSGTSQLFRLRRPGGDDLWLVVSPKKGAWVSTGVKEREETTGFTSKLRAELERARFLWASQIDMDRVFEFGFEGKEGRRLIVELMPPGNVVVLGPDGRVRLAMDEVRAATRRVVRGEIYQPPKQGRLSPLEVTPSVARAILSEEQTVGRAVGRHVALPRKYVSEALRRLGAGSETPSGDLAGREEELAAVLAGMVKELRERPAPLVCAAPEGDEVFAITPKGLPVKAAADTLSELCDALFLEEALASSPEPEPEEVRRREIQATVAELRKNSEALTAEASALRVAAAAAAGSSLEGAIKLFRESGLGPARDPASPAAAASALYDRAKQLEAKASQSVEAAAKLEKKAAKPVPKKATRAKPVAGRKREWYEKFRWFVTHEGRLAVGGRDAQTNSYLLTRHLDPDDTVFHADLFGSPFFVLKGGEAQNEEESAEVAQATVAFSSAWKTGLGSADAYWVKPDQVSSSAPSGEYLPRGSFVIRGKKNFVPRMVVEVALGVDAEGRLMAGPESAVRVRCPHYVVVRPHNTKGSETAKSVLSDIGGYSTADGVTLDEVQRALPAGGGKVVRRA